MPGWDAFTDLFHDALTFLHGLLDGVFGAGPAWGWAIILLTVGVRVLLLPLAVKQTRSMRGMQKLQPKIKKIQDKYKADRELLKKDPEKYKAKRQKMNEEMMALYREEGVNPASGCLPLLLQAPIFFALFSVLRDDTFTALQQSDFYFLTDFTGAEGPSGLGALANSAGWPGWLLIILMAVTMFITQRQMMQKTGAEGTQATQQKVMMYVMPVFLAFIGQSLPLGVLLYWVTTNVWQLGQQEVILYEVRHDADSDGDGSGKGGSSRASGKGAAASTKPEPKKAESKKAEPKKAEPEKAKPKSPPRDAKARKSRGHTPSRQKRS